MSPVNSYEMTMINYHLAVWMTHAKEKPFLIITTTRLPEFSFSFQTQHWADPYYHNYYLMTHFPVTSTVKS